MGGVGTNRMSRMAVFAGDWSARDAQSFDRSVVVGVLAGAYTTNVTRSVGVGAGSLWGASGIRDCVAIGFNAGHGWRDATNCVDIGGAFLADGVSAHVRRDALLLGADAALCAEIRFDPATGSLVVCTNGVPAGRIAIVPLEARP